MLDQLRTYLGQDRVNKVILRHKAAASFVLSELTESLTPLQQAECNALAAHIDSHLSHNFFIQRPLFEAWAILLSEIIFEQPFTILIPAYHHLDFQSKSVLRSMWRVLQSPPNMLLGYQRCTKLSVPDDDGIIWTFHSDYLDKFIVSLELNPEVEVIDLTTESETFSESDDETQFPFGTSNTLNQFIEPSAWSAFQSSTGPLNFETCALVITAMQEAFRSFGFTNALKLGMELLNRDPKLDQFQKAEFHGIIGLSAHNRQFLSANNHLLTDFLEYHFKRALDAEIRPEIRCALLYRLAVTLGRRKKDFEAGMKWANQAVNEAQSANLPELQKNYLEAWGRNIRAYVLMRMNRIEDAIKDSETAFSLLDKSAFTYSKHNMTIQNRWSREFVMSRSVLASNLCTLAHSIGDVDSFAYWREREFILAGGILDFDTYMLYKKAAAFYKTKEIRQSLPWILKGIEATRANWDGYWELRYLAMAVSFCDSIGEYDKAYNYLRQIQFIANLDNDSEYLYTLALIQAGLCIRSNRWNEAQSILEQSLDDPNHSSNDARAEISALLGVIAANKRDERMMETRINTAIDLAVVSGERNTLFRIASLAGYASQLVHKLEQAKEAYGRALEIAEVDKQMEKPVPAATLLSVFIGLYECGDHNYRLVLQALKLIPVALDSSETWWNLRRFLLMLTSVAREIPNVLDRPELFEPLEKLVTAASQRSDCTKTLKELLEILPSKTIVSLRKQSNSTIVLDQIS